MVIGELLASIGADITPLREGLVAANKEIKAAQDKMAKSMESAAVNMGKSMQKTGKTLSAALTLPLAGVAAGSFKLANDFEASMSQITGLVGIAKEQVDSWGKDIIKMAPEMGKAPKELADALFFVTSAGIKGAEAMEVLEMSAKASAAGLGETKIVADLVTSAMNAYGIETLSAEQATDILVATVREGKAPADALAGAMGQVLPVASEMQVSFDQVGAAIAAMTRTGTDANSASTQLKAIMVSLLKPTQQAEEALQGMGTSSSELRKSIREDGLIKTLGEIRTLTNKFGEEALSTVFPNVRALTGVLDLMGSNSADNIAIFEALTDSTDTLNRAFTAATETGQFTWNQTMAASKAALTALGETVQEAFLPILQNLTEKLTAVTDWFTNLSDSQKRLVVIVGAVVAGIGPLLFTVGKLMTTIPAVVGGFKMMVGTFKAVGIAMKALTATMAINPIMLAVIAVVAAAGAAYAIFSSKVKSAAEIQEDFNKLQKEVSVTDSLDAMIARYEELSEKEKLTNTEQEEYNNLIKTMSDQYPDAIEKISKHGKILGVNTDKLKEYSKEQREAQKLIASENLKDTEKSIDKVTKKLKQAQMGMQETVTVATGSMYGSGTTEVQQSGKARKKAAEEYIELQAELDALKKSQKEYYEMLGLEPPMTSMEKIAAAEQRKLELIKREDEAAKKKADKEKIAKEAEEEAAVATAKSATSQVRSIKTIEAEIKSLQELSGSFSLLEPEKEIQNALRIEEKMRELEEARNRIFEDKPEMTILPDLKVDDFNFDMEEQFSLPDSMIDDFTLLEMSLLSLESGMSLAAASAGLFGEAFDESGARLNSLRFEIEKLVEEGIPLNSEAIQSLSREYQALQAEIEKTEARTVNLGGLIASSVNSAFVTLGETMGQIATGEAKMGDLFTNLLGIIGDFLGQLGQALIAAGIGAISFQTLLANPVAAIAAGTALVALGGIVKSLLSKGPGGSGGGGNSTGMVGGLGEEGTVSTVPALASGGLAYAPTMAMVGDNPRASSDPEVIAPLSKLSQYMSAEGGNLPSEIRLVATGEDLEAILRYRNKRLGNLR